MRYIKEPNPIPSNNMITMEHRGHQMTWSIKTYRDLKVSDNLVTDINNYWSRLPMDIQDKIWDVYRRCYEVFETVENLRVMDDYLNNFVIELLSYHKFDDVYRYYKEHSQIKLPKDIKEVYKEEYGPEELTYIREEYHQLLTMTIILKTMIPIWGIYINIVAIENGKSGGPHKEYRAARLLRGSDLTASEPYKRLYRYIEAYWAGDTNKQMSAAILQGYDDAQMPNYITAHNLIRRVATAELIQANSPEEPQIMISAIYNYSEHLSGTLDKQFGGRINEKGLDSSGGSDEDNTSVIENYKIKQEISEGMIASHEVHLTHHLSKALLKLDETCPVEKLYEHRALFEQHLTDEYTINDLSLSLVRWVLHPVINARILDYVSYAGLINAHHLTYTLLKHWGFEELAQLVYAKKHFKNIVSNNVRQQVSDEQLDKLNVIYPYTPNNTLKRKLTKIESNVAMIGIRTVVEKLYGTWWHIAPWETITNVNVRNEERVIPLPSNIEPQLVDLVIFLKTKIHIGKYGMKPSHS